MHRGLRQVDQCITALSPFSVAPRFRKRAHSRHTSGKRTKLLLGAVQAQNNPDNNESWREQTDKVNFAHLSTASASGSLVSITVSSQALQQASSLWNSALDQFDSAVMPKERVCIGRICMFLWHCIVVYGRCSICMRRETSETSCS